MPGICLALFFSTFFTFLVTSTVLGRDSVCAFLREHVARLLFQPLAACLHCLILSHTVVLIFLRSLYRILHDIRFNIVLCRHFQKVVAPQFAEWCFDQIYFTN